MPYIDSVSTVNVLQTWLIETMGNMGLVDLPLGQGGLHSPSVSSRTGGRLMSYISCLKLLL